MNPSISWEGTWPQIIFQLFAQKVPKFPRHILYVMDKAPVMDHPRTNAWCGTKAGTRSYLPFLRTMSRLERIGCEVLCWFSWPHRRRSAAGDDMSCSPSKTYVIGLAWLFHPQSLKRKKNGSQQTQTRPCSVLHEAPWSPGWGGIPFDIESDFWVPKNAVLLQ